METMTARPLGGDRYAIDIRGHEVVVDQPEAMRGSDTGPTPTELFVAGLAGCVAFYAGRFCDRHTVDRAGLRVDVDWAMAEDRPARVGTLVLRVTPPDALPAERRNGFLAVARGCSVHHTLEQPPPVTIELADSDGSAEST